MLDKILDELVALLSEKTGQELCRDEVEGKGLMALTENDFPEATVLCQRIETHFGIEPLSRWGAMTIKQIAEQIVEEKGGVKMERKEILEKMLPIISNQLMVDEEKIREDLEKGDLDFTEDLGADSLDAVELIMEFEDEFDIELPDEEAENATTVYKAADLIEKWLAKKEG